MMVMMMMMRIRMTTIMIGLDYIVVVMMMIGFRLYCKNTQNNHEYKVVVEEH